MWFLLQGWQIRTDPQRIIVFRFAKGRLCFLGMVGTRNSVELFHSIHTAVASCSCPKQGSSRAPLLTLKAISGVIKTLYGTDLCGNSVT